MVHLRPATTGESERLVELRRGLWPEGSAEEHRAELRELFADAAVSANQAVLVAEEDGDDRDDGDDGDRPLLGFVEVSIRSHVEGCRGPRVGYVEGWYVVPESRGRGIGRLLIEAAESWAREQGCRELGSDAEATNAGSIAAHGALGFSVVDSIVCFRKDL